MPLGVIGRLGNIVRQNPGTSASIGTSVILLWDDIWSALRGVFGLRDPNSSEQATDVVKRSLLELLRIGATIASTGAGPGSINHATLRGMTAETISSVTGRELTNWALTSAPRDSAPTWLASLVSMSSRGLAYLRTDGVSLEEKALFCIDLDRRLRAAGLGPIARGGRQSPIG